MLSEPRPDIQHFLVHNLVENQCRKNGLNEELGRHRGKNDDRRCKLCRGECESVVHVLWECPAYDSIRNNFMVELENLLGGGEVWGV